MPGSAANGRTANRLLPAARTRLVKKSSTASIPFVADALALIDGEDDEQLAGRPDQVQTRERQDQQEHDQARASQSDQIRCQRAKSTRLRWKK